MYYYILMKIARYLTDEELKSLGPSSAIPETPSNYDWSYLVRNIHDSDYAEIIPKTDNSARQLASFFKFHPTMFFAVARLGNSVYVKAYNPDS